MYRIFAAALALLLFVPAVHPGAAQQPAPSTPAAPPPKPPDDAAAAKHAADIFEGFSRMKLINGSVLVARGDKVLYRGASGRASAEFDQPVTPATSYRIASITQLFTVAAIMRLADQGKLSLTDPVGKHVAKWPESHASITIDQLLLGNPGIKDVTQIPDFVKTLAVPRTVLELTEMILKEPRPPAPSGPGRATNASYHLLAAVIEQVSEIPYQQFLEREFLKPMGLSATRHDDPTVAVPGRAAGLMRRGGEFSNAAWFHMDNAIGMANLLSNVDDVFKFSRGLFAGKVVAPDKVAEMTKGRVPAFTPPAAPGASGPPPAPSVFLGYGLTILERPVKSYTSGGSINGFSSSLQYAPDTGDMVIVLSNVANGNIQPLVRSLVNMLAGQAPYIPKIRTSVPTRPEDLAAIAGTWDLPGSFLITPQGRSPLQLIARVENGKLFVRTTSGTEIEWLSDGPGQFYNPASDAQIVIRPDKPGEPLYTTFGATQTLKRVS